jgi:iron(III) transport system ATP-binding protein
MGLDHVDAGQVIVGGTVLADDRVHVPTERRRVGYVSQEGALFPQLTVGENVGFGLARGERKASHRVDEVLTLVGLRSDFGPRYPSELSGGEQRRVALARALAPRPRVILLDEPFSGLDAALRIETREAVLHALAEEESTALLVTHDQAEALSMGDLVGVLRDGRLVQLAEPEVLYREPVDLSVARFVGEAVVLTGVVQSGTVRCALGVLLVEGPHGEGTVEVMVRPEQVRVVAPEDDAVPNAVVTRRRFWGPEVTVSLRLRGAGLDDIGEVTARTRSHAAPRVGDEVGLQVTGSVRVYRTKHDDKR